MFPATHRGRPARREEVQRHTRKVVVDSGERGHPMPPHLPRARRQRAVVRLRPLPAFTWSGMADPRKGSMENARTGSSAQSPRRETLFVLSEKNVPSLFRARRFFYREDHLTAGGQGVAQQRLGRFRTMTLVKNDAANC